MAKKRKPQTLHEVERGEILRYLLEVYPAGATPKALQNHLDYMRYNVSDDDLEFDLAYLDEKHFISIEIGERSEEHTSELQSPCNLVCRLLLEKKKQQHIHRLAFS